MAEKINPGYQEYIKGKRGQSFRQEIIDHNAPALGAPNAGSDKAGFYRLDGDGNKWRPLDVRDGQLVIDRPQYATQRAAHRSFRPTRG